MTYAPAHRPFHDADSHIMELPVFLRDDVDPAIREQISQVSYEVSLVTDEEFEVIVAESGTPFVLHVGGSPLQLDPRWANTGRPAARDWMGGGENIRSKDRAVLHQGPETFISVMIMDGVFEQHPALRGACVELGAGWVPAMLTRLDWVVRSWSTVDQYLAELQRTPSETLREQMAFTPYVFEDVGALVDQSAADLHLFSSDYPHVEGGRDPIGRFEGSLGDRPDDVRDQFFAENFLRIFPDARVH